jgi:DNA helicase HerA-like ATPase
MSETGKIFVGGGGKGYALPQTLLPGYGNRHGLIAGATGTGKTVALQVLAEGFSAAGVPLFLADVKGDLAGLSKPGSSADTRHEAFVDRAATIGLELQYRVFPVTFWDLFGQQGHPIRTTVAKMGPVLLSRLMELTEPQEGVLNIAFRLSDDEGLPLLDLKDLQALLVFIGANAGPIGLRCGNVSAATVGSIQRRPPVLENQGGAQLFGEPALDPGDLMAVDASGAGRISILAADRLMASPRLYATFLLWMLSDLFGMLPEAGDPDKPKLVFCFDEAHLLFRDAPKALVDKVRQVARLIRSKGVGVCFISQSPDDLPEIIFTARDQKAQRPAARTYRDNPRFSIEQTIRDVGTGEAVTSFPEAKGAPGMVGRTLVRPPSPLEGPIDPAERAAVIASSPLKGKQDAAVDRDSAFEMLRARAQAAATGAGAASGRSAEPDKAFNNARRRDGAPSPKPASKPAARRGDSVSEAFAKSFARQRGGKSGQAPVRGVPGSLFKAR